MTGIVIREINIDFRWDKIKFFIFFFVCFFFFGSHRPFLFLVCGTLKNETPVHDREPPENIRSEVIQTTCSAGQRLAPTSASFSKCGAVKNEQSLFIQTSAKQNSTAPRGPDTKYSKALLCQKGYVLTPPPLIFCLNSVTNST